MTLRDNICNNIPEVTCKNVDFLEKIADDYAIEFMEWIVKKELFNPILYKRIEIIYLLEIFKKEKGL